MTTAGSPLPDRDPGGLEDRPGRSGADVGDDTGGQGSEFAGDAAAADTDVADGDGDAWFAAHGSDAGDR